MLRFVSQVQAVAGHRSADRSPKANCLQDDGGDGDAFHRINTSTRQPPRLGPRAPSVPEAGGARSYWELFIVDEEAETQRG